MMSDLLALVLRANVVAAVVILAVLALRPLVTRRFGARVTYAQWAVAPLAVLTSLMPARRIVVEPDTAAALVAAQRAALPAPTDLEAMVPDAVHLAAPTFDPTAWLLAAWALGVGVSLLILVQRQARFRRSLGALRPEGGLFRAEASGVGPAVVGALFPRIVAPADFEARFDADERRLVLAHEETHFRRGDPLANAALAVARCLCWFNPMVHVAAFYVRLDQELACDAAVVARFPADRRRYAEAMLKTGLAPMTAPLACYWPGRSAHPMKRRIAMLKAAPTTAPRRVAGLVVVGALSLGAGVAAWAAQPVRIEMSPRPQATPAAYVSPIAERKANEVEGAQRVPLRRPQLGAQLVEAVDEGFPDMIRGLVKAGADVDHYAPGEGTPLVQAARLGDLRTARLLLANGADVNKAAPGDGNPLIMAAAHRRLEMVELLVEAGADVNAYVPYDETPLINAARGGDVSVVAYLIERGADPNLAVPSRNRPGEMRSPLSMAANDDVADFLKRHGARR
jgi:beta-lactamase regulating signal transducer with metallopeptidase domain